MNYTNVRLPVWANKEKTKIDCEVIFTQLGDEYVPFTSNSIDTINHSSKEIFDDCKSGKYGVIGHYDEKYVDEKYVDENQPISPEVLLETAKFKKIDAINYARDIEIGKGVYFDSILYDSNPESRSNMIFKLNAIEPNDTVFWRAKNNTIVELSYAQLENLIRNVDEYVQQQYEKSWRYKDTIFASTTIEEVNSVVWN
jgi:hypothetical protein